MRTEYRIYIQHVEGHSEVLPIHGRPDPHRSEVTRERAEEVLQETRERGERRGIEGAEFVLQERVIPDWTPVTP